jgi:hypothetical protein
LVLWTVAVCANATVIEVPQEWPTVQAGIHAAADGDTVLVSEGTYYENIRFYGKRILVTSYIGVEAARRLGEEVVLDGRYPVDPDSSAVVYFVDGEDSTSVLRGFTITNGAGHLSCGRRAGGGIFCEFGSPTIEGNLIVGNSAHCGGAIHYKDRAGQRLRVIGNEIRWNAAACFGGGIWIPGSFGYEGSSILIEDNLIHGNTASTGGAMAMQYTQSNRVVLRGNCITDNFATYAGGLWSDKGHSLITFERNLIAGNTGAGVIIADYDPGSELVLLNNTICGNTKAVDIWYALAVEITNNIITGNEVGIELRAVGEHLISYNDVWDNRDGDYVGCQPGFGDISDDPLFVDGIPFDYHLTGDSPCIDTGDPETPPDPDGTRADMGAFYFHQGVCGMAEPVREFLLDGVALSAWPTLFTRQTGISLVLTTRQENAALGIYDLGGRLLKQLHSGATEPGRLRFVWDGCTRSGDQAPAGVYFCRFTSGGRTVQTRLIRLR